MSRSLDARLAIAAAAIWLGLALVVDPRGDFPLFDDWRFGEPIRALLAGQGLMLQSDTPMTYVGQIPWALPFAAVNGFSYTATRMSTLVAAAVCVMVAYRLFRELGTGARTAWLAAAALGLNPTFFILSYTTMTDVPFAAASTWAMLWYARALRSGSTRDVGMAALATIIATLIRQIALFPALAFLVVALVRRGAGPAIPRAAATWPLAAGTLAFITCTILLKLTGNLPEGYNLNAGLIRRLFEPDGIAELRASAVRALMLVAYLGLFALPVALGAAGLTVRRGIIAASVVTASGLALVTGRAMPWSAAFFYDFGLGPINLVDAMLGLPAAPTAPPWAWAVVTVAAITGGVVVAAALLPRLARLLPGWPRDGDPALALFATALVLYSAPLVLTGFYDRYLLPALPWAFGLLLVPAGATALPPARWRRAAAWGLVAAFGVFAVAGTRDCLEWNRARWHAIDYLVRERGADPLDIDGGYEFNGPRRPRDQRLQPAATFRVAMGPLPGHRAIRTFPFTRLLGRDGEIVVLTADPARRH
jgi:hypothetical protein